jgi:xanthine dehydrogenase iron-sulfur cluster and FAD-binding subunit A
MPARRSATVRPKDGPNHGLNDGLNHGLNDGLNHGLNVVLDVNGREHALVIEPRRTLVDVLRVDLGMTGTKKVCDMGDCGACTVQTRLTTARVYGVASSSKYQAIATDVSTTSAISGGGPLP